MFKRITFLVLYILLPVSTSGNQMKIWWHSFQSWRHQIEAFSALLALCVGNSPVTDEFPSQRPVTQSFDVFSYLRLNKRLSKQWRRWWFGMASSSLWRHRNANRYIGTRQKVVYLQLHLMSSNWLMWWRVTVQIFVHVPVNWGYDERHTFLECHINHIEC